MALAAGAGFLGALIETVIVGQGGTEALMRLFVVSAAALMGLPQWAAFAVIRRLVHVARLSEIWVASTVFVLSATVLAALIVVGGSLWLPRLLGPLGRRIRLPLTPGV